MQSFDDDEDDDDDDWPFYWSFDSVFSNIYKYMILVCGEFDSAVFSFRNLLYVWMNRSGILIVYVFEFVYEANESKGWKYRTHSKFSNWRNCACCKWILLCTLALFRLSFFAFISFVRLFFVCFVKPLVHSVHFFIAETFAIIAWYSSQHYNFRPINWIDRHFL